MCVYVCAGEWLCGGVCACVWVCVCVCMCVFLAGNVCAKFKEFGTHKWKLCKSCPESDNPMVIHSEAADDIRGCSLYLGLESVCVSVCACVCVIIKQSSCIANKCKVYCKKVLNM